jgi:hypothetical protein
MSEEKTDERADVTELHVTDGGIGYGPPADPHTIPRRLTCTIICTRPARRQRITLGIRGYRCPGCGARSRIVDLEGVPGWWSWMASLLAVAVRQGTRQGSDDAEKLLRKLTVSKAKECQDG